MSSRQSFGIRWLGDRRKPARDGVATLLRAFLKGPAGLFLRERAGLCAPARSTTTVGASLRLRHDRRAPVLLRRLVTGFLCGFGWTGEAATCSVPNASGLPAGYQPTRIANATSERVDQVDRYGAHRRFHCRVPMQTTGRSTAARLNLVLIPRCGMIGAAIAALVSGMIWRRSSPMTPCRRDWRLYVGGLKSQIEDPSIV
jgi:hypothetical protein